ncbi:hypothetical protein COOONC_02537 [Cooperia oncophora]
MCSLTNFAELRGTKDALFANKRASLYKSRVEKLYVETSNSMERIRSTAESLSMAYDMYNLLVIASTTKDERHTDRPRIHSGTSSAKELGDFFADFKHQVEKEIREAQIQEEGERHHSISDEMENKIGGLQKELQVKYEHVHQQLREQDENIKVLSEKIESISSLMTKIHELLLKNGEKETRPFDKGCDEAVSISEGETKTISDVPEEDMLDLDYDYESISDQSDLKTDTTEPPESLEKEKANPNQYPGEQERRKLEDRIEDINEFLRDKRHVPERRIRKFDNMRFEERYLICSFCFAKGQHYSDSCPKFSSTEMRKMRARCWSCLDSRHDTTNCWNESKKCYYCGSKKHNKALCTLPEEIHDYYKELEELHRELESFEDFYGPSTTSSKSSDRGECHRGD